MGNNTNYPDSVNWYLCASSQEETSEGTAVAVRLRKKDEPEKVETFLLTCAHVVRRNRTLDGNLGQRLNSIRVQPPDVGYGVGLEVEIVEAGIPLGTRSSDGYYDHPIEDIGVADWVLLRFKDAGRSYLADPLKVVNVWGVPQIGDKCVVGGYPGGHEAFSGQENGNDNIVRPQRRSDEPIKTNSISAVSEGLVTLDGTDTRGGMSGGAVFRVEGTGFHFVGLHRARHDGRLQLKAVSADAIRNQLGERGYQPTAPSYDVPQTGAHTELEKATAHLRDEAVSVLQSEPTRKFLLTKNSLDPTMAAEQLVDEIFAIEPHFRARDEYSTAMCYLQRCTLGETRPEECQLEVFSNLLRLTELLAPISFVTDDEQELAKLMNAAVNHAKVSTDQRLFAAARAARFLGLKANLTEQEVIDINGRLEFRGSSPTGEGKLHVFGSPPIGAIEEDIVEIVGRTLQSILSAPTSRPSAIRGQLRELSHGRSYVCLWINRAFLTEQFEALKRAYPDAYFLYSGGPDESDVNWLVYAQIQKLHTKFSEAAS